MSELLHKFDCLVIGGGPSGQKAAIQGAKAGRKVCLVEEQADVGGECVHRGTIPSKTLRETAVYISGLRRRSQGVIDVELSPQMQVAALMRRMRSVQNGHTGFMAEQLARNNVVRMCGRARFTGENSVRITGLDRSVQLVEADKIVVATGSRPRNPADIPIDHENILDSDSILSLIYLPESLVVLGGGVIACEFASIFACLGVKVTIIDHYERPLGFLDPELTERFQQAFEKEGGRYLGQKRIRSVEFDGLAQVRTELESGEVVEANKVFCALGRIANVGGLNLAAAGLAVTDRGLIPVNENGQTSQEHIYAVGDVIGPPALAATAVAQGRHAMRHALGLSLDGMAANVPVGIYTIPEMASIGMTEAQVIAAQGEARVGRALFAELARGQISGNCEGLIKLVTDVEGKRLLGCQIVGEGATEMIHVAQMAIYAGLGIEAFLDNVFNFPTLAEGFRVAALDISGQVGAQERHAA